MSTCQRRGCVRLIGPGKFACDYHWLEVPIDVRGELVDALARFGEDDGRTGAAVERVVLALRTARGPA